MFGQNDPTTAWRSSSVMITLIDETAEGGSKTAPHVRLPLRVRGRDASGIEGITPSHLLIRRTVRVNGRIIEVWVQFGHRHLTRRDLRTANELLRDVDIID